MIKSHSFFFVLLWSLLILETRRSRFVIVPELIPSPEQFYTIWEYESGAGTYAVSSLLFAFVWVVFQVQFPFSLWLPVHSWPPFEWFYNVPIVIMAAERRELFSLEPVWKVRMSIHKTLSHFFSIELILILLGRAYDNWDYFWIVVLFRVNEYATRLNPSGWNVGSESWYIHIVLPLI